MIFAARHISVSINCPATEVYEFAADPRNLPRWATGLSGSIEKVGEQWIAEAPMGKVKVAFANRNPFGVLDHEVELPSGLRVYNAMRVLPNNDGSEVIFTLYRRPEMSDRQFAADARWVAKDLRRLKVLLEP